MPTPANHTILVDSNGKPIPQYFVPGVGFKPLKGAGDNGPEYVIKSSALPTGAATESTLAEIKSYILSLLQQAATKDKQDALAALVGALTATAETDPTESASLIALLKGILKQLQGDGEKPNVTQLTGSYVEIGGVSFAVSGGDTLRNTAANKPDAAAAHAVIPFCYYFSVDTGIVEVTDGTNWVVI